RIQLGAIAADGTRGVVQDLRPLEQNLGISVGGIVGLDILSMHNFTIDYKKKKIIFAPSAALKNSVRFERQAPLLTVKATIEGQEVRLIVDSGTLGVVVSRNRIATGAFHLVQA